MYTSINLLGVILAGLAYFLLGWLWYSSFLFGDIWIRTMGLKMERMAGDWTSMFVTFIMCLISAFLLSVLILYAPTYGSAIFMSLIAGLIVCAVGYTNVIFEKRSYTGYIIGAFYNLLGFLLMGVILGYL